MSGGVLVRVTHDHSYVEELVDAGQITTDEARVHPSRSIITARSGQTPICTRTTSRSSPHRGPHHYLLRWTFEHGARQQH